MAEEWEGSNGAGQMAVQKWSRAFTTALSLVKEPLPANVHLLTLQKLDDEHVLLRLAHLYEVEGTAGYDTELSQPAYVDLCSLFLIKLRSTPMHSKEIHTYNIEIN